LINLKKTLSAKTRELVTVSSRGCTEDDLAQQA